MGDKMFILQKPTDGLELVFNLIQFFFLLPFISL